MDFFEFNQHIQDKKVADVERQINEIREEAERRLIEEGFWGDMAKTVGKGLQRAVWGPQAADQSRPMANWTMGDRFNNWIQPPENRVNPNDVRIQQLQQQLSQAQQAGNQELVQAIQGNLQSLGVGQQQQGQGQQQQGQQQQGQQQQGQQQQGQGGDDSIFQDLRTKLPDIGRQIAQIQDGGAKQALQQQFQSLFNLLHKTQLQGRQQAQPKTQQQQGQQQQGQQQQGQQQQGQQQQQMLPGF